MTVARCASATGVRIGRVTDAPSWWWADLGGLPAPRPALDGDREADVCIVGAGYTGLWTAYELLRADPSLAVVVLEREVAGFGASGRNGGWVLGEVSTGSRQREAARRGRDRGARARGPGDRRRGRRRVRARGHRLRLRQGRLADRRADRRRSSRACARRRAGELLDVDEAAAARARRRRCAARASRRTARACSRRSSRAAWRRRSSATARRSTRARAALDIAPGSVRTRARAPCAPAGSCAPPRATPPRLPGLRARAAAAVELDDRHRAARRRRRGRRSAGRAARPLDDAAHAYIYAQRTADGRIAIGGRGRPYRFGSGTDRAGEIPDGDRAPAARAPHPPVPRRWRDVRLDGAWTGVFGVARDWAAAVHCDRDSGLCWAGGYAGEGVAAANLAAPHAARPDPRPRHRARPPAVGRPPRARLGARAAALARASRRSTAPSARPTRSRTARGGRRGWRGRRGLWPGADCRCPRGVCGASQREQPHRGEGVRGVSGRALSSSGARVSLREAGVSRSSLWRPPRGGPGSTSPG